MMVYGLAQISSCNCLKRSEDFPAYYNPYILVMPTRWRRFGSHPLKKNVEKGRIAGGMFASKGTLV